jgi:iron complex transport system substrate-binding protein
VACKKGGIYFIIVLSMVFLVGTAPCFSAITVHDAVGREVVIPKTPQRIISLAPSITEILFALGQGSKVVGVTDYCNYPAAALAITKVGGFSDVRREKVIALRPDLVFVSAGMQLSLVNELENYGLSVVVLDAKSIPETCQQIILAGRICGASPQAGELVKQIENDLREVERKVAHQPKKPRVFFEVFDNPLYTAGGKSFIHDLIQRAGGINVAGGLSEEYPVFSLEALLAEQPDIYLTYSHNTSKTAAEMLKRPGFDQLRCLKEKRLYFLDSDLITRSGPRIGTALRKLAQIFYPELWGRAKQ